MGFAFGSCPSSAQIQSQEDLCTIVEQGQITGFTLS